jgi:hypothetical protein
MPPLTDPQDPPALPHPPLVHPVTPFLILSIFAEADVAPAVRMAMAQATATQRVESS